MVTITKTGKITAGLAPRTASNRLSSNKLEYMSLNYFFRSFFIGVFLFGFFSFFIPAFAQFDSVASKLTYPVRELGNCTNFLECQAYCTRNTNLCLSYFIQKGYITKEDAIETQTAVSSVLPGTSVTTLPLNTTSASPTNTLLNTATQTTQPNTTITNSPTPPLVLPIVNSVVATPSYAGTPITLSIPSTQKIQGSVALYVNAPGATKVQILVGNSTSVVPLVLGEAIRGNNGQWVFVWNTTQKENGTYIITPRIAVNTSVYNGAPISVTVFNTATPSVLPAPSAKDLSALANTISNTKNDVIVKKEEATKTAVQAASDYVKTISQSLPASTKTEETRTWLETKEKELMDLAEAASRKKAIGAGSVSKEINPSIASIKAGAEDILGKKIATSSADKELVSKLGEAETLLSETQTLLAERVGTAVTTDSDGDEISDYDELFIYGTNILAIDTDNDGITDGKEIESRTSPNNNSPEVIVPENVQTTGLVAKDLLTITDVKAGEVGLNDKGKSEVKSLIFRGKSLPNSFVTVFIFSDPIIVTVKTNGEGEWEYTFDKELPNGRHNVYTAIVGNAGKILAKSDAVPFIKEAEAVTFGKNITPDKPSVLSIGSIIVITSLVLVAVIGVLVLIGISRRNKSNFTGGAPPIIPPLSSSL